MREKKTGITICLFESEIELMILHCSCDIGEGGGRVEEETWRSLADEIELILLFGRLELRS
jgi:hypothetical protein